MQYLIYIPLALLPSIIWLFFYLRKDKHPEPKAMILKVFIWGILIAFPAILAENLAIDAIKTLGLPNVIHISLVYLIAVAITEEVLKFLVVYLEVFKRTTQMDEPIDAMMYMIVAALGFAAIENTFLVLPLFQDDFTTAINVLITRFVGATFLHVLASAIIGYYFALSLFKPEKRFPLLIHGFALAILLHGFYNILVVYMEDNFLFIFPTAIIILSSALLISSFIKKLYKLKSISI